MLPSYMKPREDDQTENQPRDEVDRPVRELPDRARDHSRDYSRDRSQRRSDEDRDYRDREREFRDREPDRYEPSRNRPDRSYDRAHDRARSPERAPEAEEYRNGHSNPIDDQKMAAWEDDKMEVRWL